LLHGIEYHFSGHNILHAAGVTVFDRLLAKIFNSKKGHVSFRNRNSKNLTLVGETEAPAAAHVSHEDLMCCSS
jgi:hypothetical protein